MLCAFGHLVATCWVLLAQIWPVSNLSQQHPTCCNTSQHGGQTHATCCAQQCCDILCWHAAIVWLGLENLVHSPKRPKYNHDLDISCIPLPNSLQWQRLHVTKLAFTWVEWQDGEKRTLISTKWAQDNASTRKAWTNVLASRSKFLTWVYLASVRPGLKMYEKYYLIFRLKDFPTCIDTMKVIPQCCITHSYCVRF